MYMYVYIQLTYNVHVRVYRLSHSSGVCVHYTHLASVRAYMYMYSTYCGNIEWSKAFLILHGHISSVIDLMDTV